MTDLPSYSHYDASLSTVAEEFHLHEILGALSHAIDMTEGHPPRSFGQILLDRHASWPCVGAA